RRSRQNRGGRADRMRVLALLAALLPGAALAHGAGRLEPIRPGALAVGPNRVLYVADTAGNRVLARRPDGSFRVVATGLRSPAGVYGIGRPATKASADGPNGIAFDRAGNLFVAGSNTKTLLMVASDGTMRLPAGTDGFYPRGNGGLVSTADGRVLAMNGEEIV